jgi:DNA-binding protein YbaB
MEKIEKGVMKWSRFSGLKPIALTNGKVLTNSLFASRYHVELIINSVVLLFVNEVDSQVFSIAYIFNSKWLHTVVDEAEEYSDNLLEQDVVDDSVLEAAHEAKSESRSTSSRQLGSLANSLRASAQDQARASGSSSKRRLGASSIRSRSMKSSNLRESQQRELMMKFESLQRQMSELQAELTGESPVNTLDSGADGEGEKNDQGEQDDEIPQQQSSCAVQ